MSYLKQPKPGITNAAEQMFAALTQLLSNRTVVEAIKASDPKAYNHASGAMNCFRYHREDHPFSTIPQEDQIPLEIALRGWLCRHTDEMIRNAHPESALGKALRMYNRIQNLQHGNHIDWDLTRWCGREDGGKHDVERGR